MSGNDDLPDHVHYREEKDIWRCERCGTDHFSPEKAVMCCPGDAEPTDDTTSKNETPELDPYRVRADGIDADMKRCQWVNWAIEGEDGKVPNRPSNPRRKAKSNDATTWASFEDALQNAEGRDLGVGFPLAQATPFVALDIDIPDDDPEGEGWIPDLDRLGGAVIERSPGGSLRVYLRDVETPEWWTNLGGNEPDTREVKVFVDSGYVTATGDVLDGHEPPIGETSQVAFTTWLKEAWRAFADEDEPEPWETDSGEAVSTPQSRGLDTENHPPSGRSTGSLGIYDVISRSEHPPDKRGEHPYHGSSTGTNFKVDEDGEAWRCWRHDTGGYAISLVGMEAGLMDCEDNFGELTPAAQREVYDAARERGYDVGEPPARETGRSRGAGTSEGATTHGGAAAQSASAGGPADGETDEEDDDGESDPWEDVRWWYANDENEDSKAAMNRAVELAGEDIDVMTHDESEALFLYDSADGIYHRQGEHRVQEYLNDDETLGGTFYPSRARNIIETLKYTSYTPESDFGAPENRICVANGVLDVSDPSDPTRGEHNPDHGFINGHPVEFDRDAECPEFMEFIDAMVRDEDRKKLQEYAGYCLHTWEQRYKKAMMLVGPTNSGKGTFLRILTAVIGEDNVSSETLENLTEGRWAAAHLYEAVANIRNEMSTTKLKHTERFKEMTGGGDRMSAEFKNEQKFRFTVTQKFLFATNQVPEVNGDDAFNNRWLFASFPHTIPEPEIDPDLDRRIIENELSGVLNWALEGYARLREQGYFSDERGMDAKDEMWKRYGDTVERFKHACLEVTGEDDDALGKKWTHEIYSAFCTEVGREPKKQGPFTKALTSDAEIGQSKRTWRGETDTKVYTGVRFDADALEELDAQPFDGDGGGGGDHRDARLDREFGDEQN